MMGESVEHYMRSLLARGRPAEGGNAYTVFVCRQRLQQLWSGRTKSPHAISKGVHIGLVTVRTQLLGALGITVERLFSSPLQIQRTHLHPTAHQNISYTPSSNNERENLPFVTEIGTTLYQGGGMWSISLSPTQHAPRKTSY